RWRRIKTLFTRSIPKGEYIPENRAERGERGIWQRRFYERLIRNEEDYFAHIRYIHYNPTKHGLVKRPVDWQYSTIHQYIENGVYDKSWNGQGMDWGMDYE